MIKKAQTAVRGAIFCLPMALLAGCGSGGSEAVQGTVVNIDPSSLGQNVTVGNTSSIVTEEFTIELRSPTGNTQNRVNLSIYSPGILFFVDTSANPHTYIPMGGAGNTYEVTTDSNGVYTTAVSFTSPVSADGDVTILSARSSTGYNRVNITYTCVDNPPTTCP